MDSTFLLLTLAFILVILVFKGVKIVPQQQAWIIERLGKFDRKLEAGLNLLVPYIDRVAYKHTLKEDAVDVPEQSAITKDNVTLRIDGVLYLRIIDPVNASYGVANPYYAVTQLAQTTMRSEIGKMTMDTTFEERETLNTNIVNSINEAATAWGVQCMRYEIKDISPPQTIITSMEQQAAAERNRRALVLDSEGRRQAQINIAEGQKQEIVLQSEASKTDQINRAQGEAEAILAVAEATAKSIQQIGTAIQMQGGTDAVSLRIAEQYVEAFRQLAQKGTTILLPANSNDVGGVVAQAMTIFETVKSGKKNG